MDRVGSRGNISLRRLTLGWDLKNYLHWFNLMSLKKVWVHSTEHSYEARKQFKRKCKSLWLLKKSRICNERAVTVFGATGLSLASPWEEERSTLPEKWGLPGGRAELTRRAGLILSWQRDLHPPNLPVKFSVRTWNCFSWGFTSSNSHNAFQVPRT